MLALAVGAALAPATFGAQVEAAGVPAAIGAEYEKADESACKVPARAVRQVYFQGDRTPFYVVDEHEVECKEVGSSPYCGSGGCGLSVFVQMSDGYKSILNDLVVRHSIRKIGRGAELLVVHKSITGKPRYGRYRFEKGGAIEIGAGKPPSC
jgi:hypothetical protein